MTQECWIETDRGRLYAKRWRAAQARGVPIVLWHDSLGCVELWREFPAQLAAATGCDVIAYDRLGFGKSDAHPGRLDFDFVRRESTEAVPVLQRHFAFDRFVAFGHSVGGGMAVECAAAFASSCALLITESAQAFVEQRTLEGIRAARQNFADAGQLDRLRRYHGDKASWVLGAWIDTWLAPEFAAWDLDAALAAVRCPALVMHGENDEFGSARHPQRIAAGLQVPCEMHLLPGCGHVPHRELETTVLSLVAHALHAAFAANG